MAKSNQQPGEERTCQPTLQGDSDAFVFYTLDVAFTPYGPEILSFWIPNSVDTSEFKKGDLR